MPFLFISPDITATAYLCDRLSFFLNGNAVEEVSDMQALEQVKSEYAVDLLNAAAFMEKPFTGKVIQILRSPC